MSHLEAIAGEFVMIGIAVWIVGYFALLAVGLIADKLDRSSEEKP